MQSICTSRQWRHNRHVEGKVNVGMVEICAKILQIMRNDFKDYARAYTNYAHIMRTFFGFVLHIIGIRQ